MSFFWGAAGGEGYLSPEVPLQATLGGPAGAPRLELQGRGEGVPRR